MSYWIKEYSKYILQEINFEPKRLKAYKRGDIIKLNFGFNVGSEYGGLHYAVVINNANHRNSPVVTVVPLTSYSPGSKKHPDDVFLGNEIYKSLKIKHDTILQTLVNERKEIDDYQEAVELITVLIKNKPEDATDSLPKPDYVAASKTLQLTLRDKIEKYNYIQEQVNKIGTEISHMKSGSLALVNLTTTISKMRIYDPKNSRGVLNGIKLSEEAMEKINLKLKEFFIF